MDVSVADRLVDINTNLETIKRYLGLNRSPTTILAELKASLQKAPSGTMFESGGLCSGYYLQPMPDRYFVAQEFRDDRSDLRNALADALDKFRVSPISIDDVMWSGHILCKISAMIQSSPFGVYQLTTKQSRNVHLELGIAIGLNRPFILVKEIEADLCTLIQGLEYYSIQSYLELRYELGDLMDSFITNIATYKPQKPMLTTDFENSIVISHGDHDVLDFCVPIAKMIAMYNLKPVFLGDPTGKLPRFLKKENIPFHIIGNTGQAYLDEAIAAIQSAKMGIYRIDKPCEPNTFVALGISIGLNRPGLLVHRTDAELTADLRGLSALKFKSFSDLAQSLPANFEHLLEKYQQGFVR